MAEDADALFLGMPHFDGRAGYQPILAFETRGEIMMMVPGTAETIDPRISAFLLDGFELQTGGNYRFPFLEQWAVTIDGDTDSFALVGPTGLAAYSVALHEVTPEWLDSLRRERRLIVITGTGLKLDLATFTGDSIDSAARAGNLVGAVVPIRSHRSSRWHGSKLLRKLVG